MGLFDNFSLDNLDDPNKQALLAAGLSMLAPKPYKTGLLGDIGSSGLTGLQTLVQAKTQERANRASDLQQLSGAYNLLKQQEFARMLAAKQNGQPYSPNPMLPQMETRLGQLAGLDNLSKRYGLSAPSASPAPPQAPPSAPAMPPPGMAPPSQSPMANPDYQPPMVRPPTPQAPQTPQGQMPQGNLGGPAGGIPMEAWLAQDPTGAAYLKRLAEDNKPIALRQGDLVRRNPDGSYSSAFQQPLSVPGVLPVRDSNGQVQAFRQGPGFAESASNIKGAQTTATEGAKAPFNFQNVTMASGASVPMSIAQLMGAKVPVGASQPPSQGAQVTTAQPSKSPAVDDPWATVPKRATPQGIGQNTYDANMSKLQADTASKLAEKYGAQADVAQGRQALNNQALEALDRADTGMGAAFMGDIKNVLVSRFGIPESDFKNDPAATAILNKDLMNAAVAKAKASFGAKMSTNEVNNMLKRGAPNGDMLYSAIKFLLTADNATAGYQIQQGNNFGKYLSIGGDPMQFEAWHAKTFPLSQTLDALRLPANTPQSDNPGYGWSVKRVR